ncbi:hypothetical protein [Vibrio harveyi]|uniref:hypothetical protein n=1 Tax=Vibrio harveyi TaxID=669 RepID=UPI0008420BF1|nr:hypothetical protein [Vibrio harveyi]ODM56018.1 hypothetical protein BC455_22740 [Vibrio harveyi]
MDIPILGLYGRILLIMDTDKIHHIKFSRTGNADKRNPQWRWVGCDSMQMCVVSGAQLMVIRMSDEQPDLYELYYLGMQSNPIMGLEMAKKLAPRFVEVVFETLCGLREQLEIDQALKIKVIE